MTRRFWILVAAATMLAGATKRTAAADIAEIQRLSMAGRTLSADIAKQFPLPEQRVKNDTGVNVLVDLAHQASFVAMWSLPGELRRRGFRACGSQATLDTVLAPGKLSRVRIPVAGRWPFAWRPNPRFNVVITYQSQTRAQEYLPEERQALEEFVRGGGGLVIVAGNVLRESILKSWSLNALLQTFGARVSATPDQADGYKVPTLAVGAEWEAVRKGEVGRPVVARRRFGRGRVIVFSSTRLFFWSRRAAADAPNSRASRGRQIAEAIRWAAAGSPPVAGSRRLPVERGGGGPIYPELEARVGNVVIFYARNQRSDLLRVVREEMPKVKERVLAWYPSKPAEQVMYLILSAGGGGGWAVNAYLPKEVGIISLNPIGILSIFAHELAHTLGGPPNTKGELAGRAPIPDRGEAHAGWFQGKINAVYQPKLRSEPNRKCNRMFRFDPKANALDLSLPRAEYRKRWKKGNDWTKTWWVWQKLDDRYGPTWYPRWKWVQHMRWMNEPDHRLTWDEMVEDMSIAVGEDLFPFFRAIGTSKVTRTRLERATFLGQTIELPVAPIELTPAGPVRLEAIGDYTKPLPRPKR